MTRMQNDVHRAVKARARKERKSFAEMHDELLRRVLNMDKREDRIKRGEYDA